MVGREDLVGNAALDVARLDRLQHANQLDAARREPDVVDGTTLLIMWEARANRLVPLKTQHKYVHRNAIESSYNLLSNYTIPSSQRMHFSGLLLRVRTQLGANRRWTDLPEKQKFR